ncbi:MAG: flagellar basal-body rod protein FlgF [Gammaproteobacteria bacterium]|nr:flagellar basal-body rod protein FlgF [Gammaproteobacteria bacterium]
MDHLLYIAMTGAKQTMIAQATNSNNLANANTTGFKADLEQFRSMPVFGDGYPSRVYAMTERPGFDSTPGNLHATGRDLDLSIKGDGWFAVQGANGGEAYTRSGELRLTSDGMMMTGSGHPVLGNGGTPIIVPPAEKMEVGVDGTISFIPAGAVVRELVVLDRIKMVNPNPRDLTKGEDGMLRRKDGQIAEADANVTVVSRFLETSNVNAVSSMVKMIELSRQYELQVKMMKTAEENDSSVTSIMKLG